MAAEPDHLSDFLARIEPYRPYWRSLEVTCMAVRVESEWVQLAGVARLSTEPSEPDSMLKLIVKLKDFRAYAGRLEASVIKDLIRNLRDSMVITGMPESPIQLVPSGSRPYSWQPPFVIRASSEAIGCKQWPSMLRVLGTGTYPVSFLPQNFWGNIDTQLRRHSPPYNGFDALCVRLGLKFERFGSSAYFELGAELPARFLAGKVNRKEKSLTLNMEYVGTPELLIEWLPERQTKKEPVPIGDPEKPGQFEVTLPIPEGATGVEARLITVEADVDQLSCRVDWENVLLRICEFFDPDQTRLRDFLFDEDNLKNVNPFELGVARLLGLAGYTVLWFGKGSKDALPDLVAYAHLPLGAERVIYGECTLKNPAGKFSDLAKRAGGLREHLGLEAGAIVPIVFVRNDTTAQDRRAASELGLVVCDGGDIRRLQDKIKSDVTPDEVFQFVRSLGSLTFFLGGLNSVIG
jgi:hypothetical protein